MHPVVRLSASHPGSGQGGFHTDYHLIQLRSNSHTSISSFLRRLSVSIHAYQYYLALANRVDRRMYSAIVFAVGMLFKLIGFSAFAAVAAMLCLTPYQSTVARLFMKYQNQVLNAADDRLTLTTEVFQAIKVLKFFAWERKFAEKLAEKRTVELVALRKRVVVFAMGGVALCRFTSRDKATVHG